ncbi:hypothetical protein [Haloferula sp.]|uniref:hypothetical protein n=1 Tax=Haloferula sp. TaxID=2497595 RepID=UPI003C793FC6
MKKLPSWTWTATAIPVALIAGILLGRSTTSSEPASEKDSTAIPSRNAPTRSDLSSASGSSASKRSTSNRDVSADTSQLQLTAILESSSRLDRTQRLIAFLDRLPTDQFTSVYAEIANSPMANIRGSERSLILQAWSERDPMAAIGYLEENGAADWERETTLGTWAALDPAGAFAWASTSEDDGGTNNWMLGAMRGIAATSPELARDYLMQMENGETRNRSLKSMQAYVMQYGSDYAENWIAGISDPEIQNRASHELADDLTELDPVRAGEWNARIEDTRTRRSISETVSDRWARQDVEGARRWVESLPEDTRTEAAEGVARHYARQDPVAAADWLQGLGNNPDYDGARQTLIREAYRQNPETSLSFISNISDESERNKSYDRYLRDWIRKDSDSAMNWAQTNQASLPEKIVNRYLR